MARRGRLPARAAALALSSAALADMVLILCVVKLILPHLPRNMGIVSQLVATELRGVALFAVLLLLFWAVCEILLGGVTPGRAALDLVLADRTGARLSHGRRVTRGVSKLLFLGLNGINPFREARYDRGSGAVWASTLSPVAPRPLGEWQLWFRSGSYKGRKASLNRVAAFRNRGQIRIGRAADWADIPLNGAADAKVSAQHCVLFVQGGELFIRDGNGAGKPSSNGTYVDGRRLAPGEATSLAQARYFAVADIRVDLLR